MAGTPDARMEPIEVLHVDDEPDNLFLTAEFLAREGEHFEVHTATSAAEGLDVLEAEPIECVVSDYRMPGTNGLEFLTAVRESHPDLPFVLFTGQGSEEIAAEAITAGVSEYLQKRPGSGQYAVLANRIENLVAQYRLSGELARTRRRFEKLIEHSVEVIPVLDADGVITYVSPSARSVLGYEPEELVGENAFEYVHPDDVERVVARFAETVEDPECFPDVEYRFRAGDGSWVRLHGRAKNLLADPDVEGIVSYNRAVSDLRDE